MTYEETLAYIYGLGRFGMRPGLEKITALLAALGNPQDRVRCIHVAGTNGKGSTAAFLSSIMRCAGLSVGLFTSPHLIRFTERIQINGSEISPEEVVRFARSAMDAAPPETTFFELVTAMAWLHFAGKGVDLAVMETGMGGRLDATNSASGVMSLITPVSLDHCRYLGSSPVEIAFEKSGVIKPGRPVVTSAQSPEVLEVIAGECARLSSPLYRCGREFSGEWENDGLCYKGISTGLRSLKPGLAGSYQACNALTALVASELLTEMGFNVNEKAMRSGIEQASWPGRMEMIGEDPGFLLDGAHNPAGALALAGELGKIPHGRIMMVVGVMEDKDAGEILMPLLSLADRVYTVRPSLERAMPSARLADLCRNSGKLCIDSGTVSEGLRQAKEASLPGDIVLVCGSLFTVGEARAILLSQRFEPFRG